MESTASYLEPGTLLAGRYRIESILGKGGMGAVYLAKLEALAEKQVAIKEMCLQHKDPRSREQAVEQFRQEARFLAHLEHRNLVQVSDYFDEGGRHYLVMAYIKGKTLQEMLAARKGAFPVEAVLDWGIELAAVLSYLHHQDPPILFRDLKPANIMLDDTNTIRLIDFGIARSHAPDGVTATFMQGMGSAGYSPLEQYQGAGGTDPRSDIYSLGATLFHLLTNKLPPSPVELVADGKSMPSPRRWNPTMPAALDTVLHKMLAVRKDDRYSSMNEVQERLQQIARSLEQGNDLGEVVESLSPPSVALASPTQMMPADPNEKFVWMTMGTLAVALLAFLGWMVRQATPVTTATPVAKVGVPTPQADREVALPMPATPAVGENQPQQDLPIRQPEKRPQVVAGKPAARPSLPDQSRLRPNLPESQAYPTGSKSSPKMKFTESPGVPQVEETPKVVVVMPTVQASPPSTPIPPSKPNSNPPGNPYASYRGRNAPPLQPGWGPPVSDGKGGWVPDPGWTPPPMHSGGPGGGFQGGPGPQGPFR